MDQDPLHPHHDVAQPKLSEEATDEEQQPEPVKPDVPASAPAKPPVGDHSLHDSSERLWFDGATEDDFKTIIKKPHKWVGGRYRKLSNDFSISFDRIDAGDEARFIVDAIDGTGHMNVLFQPKRQDREETKQFWTLVTALVMPEEKITTVPEEFQHLDKDTQREAQRLCEQIRAHPPRIIITEGANIAFFHQQLGNQFDASEYILKAILDPAGHFSNLRALAKKPQGSGRFLKVFKLPRNARQPVPTTYVADFAEPAQPLRFQLHGSTDPAGVVCNIDRGTYTIDGTNTTVTMTPTVVETKMY